MQLFFLEGAGDWGLNSGLHTCKAGTILLEAHLQSLTKNLDGTKVDTVWKTQTQAILTPDVKKF
jgi:hypothetical protein